MGGFDRLSVRDLELGDAQAASEDARRGSLFQAHLKNFGESTPCFPPHPDVLQKHVAPREITLAVLAFTFSDVVPLTEDQLMAHYSSPAIVDFMSTISSNCTRVRVVPIQVPLDITQKDDSGKCRIVHATQLEALELSPIPEWLGDDGKVRDMFNSTVLVPVSSECSTSGVTGSFDLNIAGNKVSFVGIYLGKRRDTRNFDANDLGDTPGISRTQLAYVHELGHLLGHQYHSNAYQCLDPNTQQNVLECSSYEYGDDFDIMGGFGYATWMNARARYNFGWLGQDDLSLITISNTHRLRALGSEGKGPRTAVLPSLDLWLEFRARSDAAAESGRALEHNQGLFVRRWNNLVDASLGSCAPKSVSEWTEVEHREVTLGPGKVLALRDQGIFIGDVARQNDTLTFSVEIGERAQCEHRIPVIDVGMTGEWKFDQGLSEDTPPEKKHPLMLTPGLSGFSRITTHVLQSLRSRDSISCKSSSYVVGLASVLPEGWAFVAQDSASIEPSAAASVTFAFGIPQDAVDGDYDFCITATNSLGYRTAKVFRLSLPESDLKWYTNNRPAYYTSVDQKLVKNCAKLEGCQENMTSCTVPKPSCSLDLSCGAENRTARGRCWATGQGQGVQSRGSTIHIPQSYCDLLPGTSLVETSTCDTPLALPCIEQANCRSDNGWFELKAPHNLSSSCFGSHLCGSNGAVPEDDPVCKHIWSSGDFKYDHPCRVANSWNETCVKQFCEAHRECGGYQKRNDLSSFWLFAKGMTAQKLSYGADECWTKPLPSGSLSNCTCL